MGEMGRFYEANQYFLRFTDERLFALFCRNLAPPAYSVQDVHSVQHNIQAPLRYQNSSYSVTGYGTISPIKPLATPSSSYRLRDVLLHIFIGIIVGYMVQTPLDSRYRQGKRDEWALENEQHQEERTKWEHWVSARDSEKQKWDEEQAEKRSQIEWQGLQRRSCARYETRDYTATLFHVPLGLNAMEECRGKALQINGRDLLPSRCEDEVSGLSNCNLVNVCFKVCLIYYFRAIVGRLPLTGRSISTNLDARPSSPKS